MPTPGPNPTLPAGPTRIGGVLLSLAAPSETRAVADALGLTVPMRDLDAQSEVCGKLGKDGPLVSLVRTGVGKVNAALGVARCADPARHQLVLNLGVCGTLSDTLPIGGVVVASKSVYADEGVWTPDRWVGMDECGFAPGGTDFPGMGVTAPSELVARAERSLARVDCVSGVIATVSTCSGSDDLARRIRERTGAIAEAMEGAAAGHAVRRLLPESVGFLEVRVVSNSTGDRDRQTWRLREALEKLGEVARLLLGPSGLNAQV